MIISIDGPSGAGKSTLGKMIAKELGLLYLDTGAMYRAVGLAVLEAGIGPEDTDSVVKVVRNTKIELKEIAGELRIFLNDIDVSDQVRKAEIGQIASIVSSIPEVRRILVEKQRKIGLSSEKGCVLDGRDIGTVVFPDADFKFFLTANPETRARRRYEENLQRGITTTYEETLAEIKERDIRDTSREDSPLRIPKGAILIDTSEMGLKEVFERMLEIIRKKTSTSRI
ncbi:MAG: (d)CMP kinase [Pyrinomonadaceae bacterium]|nr:(d)CMP kinase [Pyrinomonadaceae bacterium]MCX7640212.1 (d)CMP kinase [Pyrinomonadaceae bacterium]MDW8303943.1 (d)CMP kinase [Acidobacteriota bacterium]